MRRLLIDTTVLVFASGAHHPQRETCRAIIAQAQHRAVALHISTETIQEFLHHRLRRGARSDAVAEARDAMTLCHLHPFDADVLTRAVHLIETTNIRGRDAVHAATALEAGFTEIVSADTDFDDVPGLTRVDPALVVFDQS